MPKVIKTSFKNVLQDSLKDASETHIRVSSFIQCSERPEILHTASLLLIYCILYLAFVVFVVHVVVVIFVVDPKKTGWDDHGEPGDQVPSKS